jgi:hypothetical protein
MMLQCPNCEEDCITYWDTFPAQFNSSDMCRRCGGLFKLSNTDIFKRILFYILSLFLVMHLWFEYIQEISELFIIIPIAIVIFPIDYLLYINSSPLKKVAKNINQKELGIIKINKAELNNLLEQLSKAKKNSFITILENEEFNRYLDVAYEENKYILTLALISKYNRELEDKFISASESLGFLVSRKRMNRVDYLEISISEDQPETIEKVEYFIKNIFNQKEVKHFTVSPGIRNLKQN